MKRHQSRILFLIVAVVFLGLTYLPLLAKENTLDIFVREDGVFEDLTAVYLFMSSIIFAVSFLRFRNVSRLLKLSFLGLALLFFVGAGEEISWGERIFHWNDHNYIRGMNVQGELTIHNLKYFQGEDAVIPISTSQVLLAFAFVFTLIIPLACRLSPKIQKFLYPIFPVMPLDLGVLSIATYIFQKSMLRILPLFPALYHHSSMPIPQGVYEIREHGFTFAILVSAISYFSLVVNAKKTDDSGHSPEILTSPSSSVVLGAEARGDKG